MSLYDKAVARYGTRIRQTGLVKRMAQITSVRGFREMTDSYLIDESKDNYVGPEEAARRGGDYLRKTLLGEAPMRPGVDYRAGVSKVWSFGRANHPVYKAHPNPLSLSDGQRLALIVDAWCKDRAKAKVVAQHLVFSLDPRLTAALGQKDATKDLPLDDLLMDCVTNAMLEYQCKFYPRDQLGFLVGVHHDKHHAHAHVLVHPITANGQRVNLSTNEVEEVDGQKVNVQYQAHLKESFTRQTDLLAEYCFGDEKSFTWIGRQPNDRDRLMAREEMVLFDRVLDEPETAEGETKQQRIRAHLRARAKLLALPNYPQIVRRARQAQRQRLEEAIADGVEPEEPSLKFGEIVEELSRASALANDLALRVATMFGETAQEPDRAGPYFPPGFTAPVSRSSAFRHLRQGESDSLPSPLNTTGFLRRRTARQMDRIDRMAETIADYAKAGRDYARVAQEQQVRLASSASILLTASAELTGRIPEFLQEPVGAAGIRLPDEALVPTVVTQSLQALSRENSRHFQPVEVSPGTVEAPSAEGEAGSVAAPSAETTVRIGRAAFPSSLGQVSDGIPGPAEIPTEKRRRVVTPDI